jgi:hypothetical protein
MSPFKGNDFLRIIDEARWILSFGDNNSMLVYMDGGVEASVTYIVSDNEITLTDLSGSCTGNEAAGIYRWRLAENVLSMALVNDLCERRRYVLADTKWQRFKEL